MTILKAMNERILVADGAMGTILYSEGLNTCPEHYNLTHPEKIAQIHHSYIQAGADLIQTNTYGANFEKLKLYGLEHRVKDIHKSAVHIAKSVATPDTFIAGTIGGFRSTRKESFSLETIAYHTELQIETLASSGVDALLFETYYDLEELLHVIKIGKTYQLPIIAQLTASTTKYLKDGQAIPEAIQQLIDIGADVVGLNCHHGPHHMIQTFKHLDIPKHAYLSCYPNASLLDIEDEVIKYSDNAVYFSNAAQSLVAEGVRLIGGCCGTTPEHIKKISEAVSHLAPVTNKDVIPIERHHNFRPGERKKHIGDLVKERPTVVVELDTPKHLDTTAFFKGVKALEEAGVDAVTLADNSLANVRISNIAAASIIKQRYNIRPLVHVTCRDHNLIGLQSHLLGLSLLGIDDILAVTGDPSKIGDFPGATSVFDVNSCGLSEIIQQFNQGINADGATLKRKTSFSVAGAFNPHTKHLQRAVERLTKKIEAGMSYFITQPVFDRTQIKEIYEATKHLDVPIIIGVMPITSYNNALFLHNEVPGIKIPEYILKQFEAVQEDRAQTKAVSIKISKQLIDEVYSYFNGLYLVTPFMKYEMTEELAKYAKEITNNQYTEEVI
ncbi:bifunctional homocysteine S-methyltransferase/methylenetetrahydrofolate reductase [Macrococcus capreoli]|uniref:bifunctional homocysteine S-methyltransferase/methylenetetrahydrofolate reductase n=1 Tax=Macrococcus capreoli TaxID=2982690 RepID=UPI0021D58019|nr:bifunctional homocysteine S-methyltransferase/methylenetetrahydrofolate reductase [Macrococcus sp. TMW 2.2395]MCU7557895.1 bifunctional homocysteine S-methyltransferase/methylenetetrahydrofolate reductase [Macrococcus sp. TMW 2.2395]